MSKEPYYDSNDPSLYRPSVCCGIDTNNPCSDCPGFAERPQDTTEAAPDTRSDVDAFLLYIQGYKDALDMFSSMLEEVIGE